MRARVESAEETTIEVVVVAAEDVEAVVDANSASQGSQERSKCFFQGVNNTAPRLGNRDRGADER